MKENSTEEDIELLQDETSSLGLFLKCKGLEKYKIALEHILSDYKRVLKENNRLEEQVEYDKTHIYTPQTIELNFISKSKIEDKIKKINKVQKRVKNEKANDVSNAEEIEDIMNRKNYTIVELVQYVLQELLERRK